MTTVSVTESGLAEQVLAYDAATWPMRQALARNIWAGWQRCKNQGISQNAYLTRIVSEIKQRGGEREVGSLFAYLYLGCALSAGLTPNTITQGEQAGRAIDRLGLDADTVQAHMEAGDLGQMLKDARSPTVTARLTTDSRETLVRGEERARQIVETDGLSPPEIRSLLTRGIDTCGPALTDALIRIGNGDIKPDEVYLVQASEGAGVASLAPPVDYVGWGKLNAPCWVCGKTPAESGRPHDAHHVQAGDHEPRPGDDTEPLWAFVCRSCHIPQPFGHTNTAHSSAYQLHHDAEKLHAYLRYTARLMRLYQEAIGAKT